MTHEYLSLQEVAETLGKSAQTIRRMIKKGDLRAERIRTPQGFQYAVPKAQIPDPRHPPEPLHEQALTSQTLTGYESPLTSQKPLPREEPSVETFLENDFFILEPVQNDSTPTPLSATKEAELTQHIGELVHLHHKEKMLLITILERLQAELAMERERRFRLENRGFRRGLQHLIKKGFRALGRLFIRWGEPR